MLRVVKLGGSLHRASGLVACLKTFVGAAADVVLVPGGGPFADAVRSAQTQTGISDAAAHLMAVLAMEQYGLMLCDLEPALVPAKSLECINNILSQGRTPVWLPSAMCQHSPDIAADWSVTSDSLAAWLAIKLTADSLTLIKSGRPGNTDPTAMAAAGWVDEAFPLYAARFGRPVHVVALDGRHNCGVPI